MRLAFFGTPLAAVPSLRALASSAHEVAVVVTQPDRSGKRGRALVPPPVKEAALELGLPLLQPESLRAAAREELAGFRPEIHVVVAYGNLLGPKLLAVAPRGAVNLHFSLLPRWRGAAPVQRSILAGDETTGISVIRLVQALDAGPVLLRDPVELRAGETATELEARLADIGASRLVEVLDLIQQGGAVEEPQDEALVTLAPPLRKEESALDPRRSALELERAVRALVPWPGARFELEGRSLQVEEARALDERTDLPPGSLMPARDAALPMACGEGVLLLLRCKPEGRASMSGRSLVDGRWARPGQRLVMPGSSAVDA